jgi:uncharacterized Ntn-hydrolase superfamily protein
MTYSIVARDAETGELGVAVQSQSFNTGAVVPWARPGVGAIATQSFTDRRYGYRGLERLAAGRSPQEALDELLEPDTERELRQVALVDTSGRTAHWTGAHCVAQCGHVSGDGWAAQGNMLAADAWHAMGAAFEAASGTLAQRLLAALEAAEAEGGDWRGRGGAGIVVVSAQGEPWERIVDLRVEDRSLPELRRVLELAEAYAADDDELLPSTDAALARAFRATRAGDAEAGRRAFAELEAANPRWREALRAYARHPKVPPAWADILDGDA